MKSTADEIATLRAEQDTLETEMETAARATLVRLEAAVAAATRSFDRDTATAALRTARATALLHLAPARMRDKRDALRERILQLQSRGL